MSAGQRRLRAGTGLVCPQLVWKRRAFPGSRVWLQSSTGHLVVWAVCNVLGNWWRDRAGVAWQLLSPCECWTQDFDVVTAGRKGVHKQAGSVGLLLREGSGRSGGLSRQRELGPLKRGCVGLAA